jgi:glycosyltransferase involved in cell wall biosynthesis
VNIAQVSDSYLPRLGGMEIQVAELAGRQRVRGHRVEVVTASAGDPERGGPERDDPERDDPEHGDPEHGDPERDDPAFPVHRVLGASAHPVAARPFAPAAAVRLVLGGGFDVVHAHVGVGSPVAFAAAAAAARAGIPTVVTVHSLWAYVHPLFRAIDVLSGLSRLPIRWTSVSEAAAGPVRRLLPPGSTVTVIPNGVDPAFWTGAPTPRDPGTVTIAAAMRLTSRKRALPLLRMLRLTRDLVPADVRLRAVVVGSGPKWTAARRYLDNHDMTSWVRLPGRVGRVDVARMYRSADLFVAPADLESFGIAALEARCAGLPVLARSSAGVGEFIRHGREGLLARDDAQMVEHLTRLATDDALRDSIRRHNRRTPCPITWDAVLERTEGAYAAALSARRCPDRPAARRAADGPGRIAAPSAPAAFAAPAAPAAAVAGRLAPPAGRHSDFPVGRPVPSAVDPNPLIGSERPMRLNRVAVAVAVTAAGLALAACSGTSSDPAEQPDAGAATSGGAQPTGPGSGGPNPNAPEQNPTGDIPDNQAFVAYSSPAGLFTVSVPEGWARTRTGTTTTFADKLNSVRIEQVAAAAAPTEASFRSGELPRLAAGTPGFRLGTAHGVRLASGAAVRVDYRATSAPDAVTGKTVEQDVQRYELWHAGQEVILTLASPRGADNVDPWHTITESFRWQR